MKRRELAQIWNLRKRYLEVVLAIENREQRKQLSPERVERCRESRKRFKEKYAKFLSDRDKLADSSDTVCRVYRQWIIKK